MVHFGIFDWVDRRHDAVTRDIYEERIEFVCAAEEAGFEFYQVAEHHGTPLGMSPSPTVLLAAIARSTGHIRLGGLVWLLPLYSPLRLYEELCMLDHLSGGRLEVGIGHGSSRHELGFYGKSRAESQAEFDACFQVLREAFRPDTSVLSISRPGFDYEDVPLVLRPFQERLPFWYPTGSERGATFAANHGMNIMGLGDPDLFRPLVECYKEQNGTVPGSYRMNLPGRDPFIGMNPQIIVAESDAEAMRLAETVHPTWAANHAHLVNTRADGSDEANRELAFEERRTSLMGTMKEGSLIVGDPERVADGVVSLVLRGDLNYVAGSFFWGTMKKDDAVRSVKMFGKEVMPRVRDALKVSSSGPR